MPFRVIVQPAASADLNRVYDFLLENFGRSRAIRWRNGFMKAVKILDDDPHRFAEAEEAFTVGVDLRCMLYGKKPRVYRILFTINRNRVRIHRVCHAAMDSLRPDDF
jgi:plasmid stabilization system protein ParE